MVAEGFAQRLLGSPAVPAVVLILVGTSLQLVSGVAAADLLRFAVYVVFGLALPGLVWVQLVRGRRTTLGEELALGLVAGYLLAIAAYLVALAAGAPVLVLAWPAITLAAAVLLPRLRPSLRGLEREPTAWWWAIVIMLLLVLGIAASGFFPAHPLAASHTPQVDMPFQLALIGELRNHVPPEIPWVAGEPLSYHWLYYPEAAATSWATGIEAQVLLYRLEALPMLAAFAVLTAAATRRLTGALWAGPVAAAIAIFLVSARPFGWVEQAVFDATPLVTLWTSPTSTFGLAMSAALVVVLLDRFGPGRARRLEWALTALLMFGAAGAKASSGPVLLCGILAVTAAGLLRDRRPNRDALVALALAAAAVAVAIVLLYPGGTGGAQPGLEAVLVMPFAIPTGAGRAAGAASLLLTGLVAAVTVLLWAFTWAGAGGLLGGRRLWRDDRLLLLLGMAGSAVAATLVLLYPGLSEQYYLRGAAGVLAILATAGLAALSGTAGPGFRKRTVEASPAMVPGGARTAAMVAVAVAAGAAVAAALQLAGPDGAPKLRADHLSGVVLGIAIPAGALVLTLAIATIAVVRAGRDPRRGVVAPLLIAAMAMGFGLPGTLVPLAGIAHPSADFPGATDTVPEDGIVAARWLRDHSGADDLVATNLHCRATTPQQKTCDARHFWVSAYTERHVLVEGWAYTGEASARGLATGTNGSLIPFWDQDRLAANDAVFEAPSEEAVAVLRDTYGGGCVASLASRLALAIFAIAAGA